jgi:hypothetical protein
MSQRSGGLSIAEPEWLVQAAGLKGECPTKGCASGARRSGQEPLTQTHCSFRQMVRWAEALRLRSQQAQTGARSAQDCQARERWGLAIPAGSARREQQVPREKKVHVVRSARLMHAALKMVTEHSHAARLV